MPLVPLWIIMDGRGPYLFSTSSTFSSSVSTRRKIISNIFVLFFNLDSYISQIFLERYFGYSNPLFLFLLLCSESVTLAGNVVICFFGTRLVRYTSIAVLFLFFLQKGCTAAYVTSTIVRRVPCHFFLNVVVSIVSPFLDESHTQARRELCQSKPFYTRQRRRRR